MYSKIVLLGLIFVALAAAEIGLRWYMGSGNDSLSIQLRDWYVYQHPVGHKRVFQGLVSFIFPSVLTGFAAGSLGSTWSPKSLALTVLMLSAGIIMLFQICIKLLGAEVFSPNYSLASIVVPVVSLCSAFAYAAKIWTASMQTGHDITAD